MNRIASTEIIDPSSLKEVEKRRFLKKLYYNVHIQIFDGIDEKKFAEYVVNSKAIRNRINVFKDDKGEPVGYHAIHVFEKQFHGSILFAVFRAESGLFREYRKKSSTLPFFLKEAFRYKLLHPFRKMYFLGTFVHPAIYYLAAKYSHEIYPNRNSETPSDILQFMCALAEDFGVSVVHENNPLVRKVGWKVRDSREDFEYWLHSDKPDVKFFIKNNPGYPDGHGLLTLAPLTAMNLLLLFSSYIKEMTLRKLEFR